MRSIWKGSINFGLVYIPVAVYPATREEKVSFKQLRASDLSPIRYRKVAESDGKEVPADEIVKGFEVEKGKWVVLKDEDFEAVQIESTHSVEITDFVEQAQINPKFFYKPYFLEPQKGGEKAYTLLHRALNDTGKIGIAKVAIKNREYLASVRPDGLFLILELMHFAQEVLEPENLRGAMQASLTPKEIEMAHALIESMTAEWQPEKYKDSYQDAIRAMIEAKAQNLPTTSKPSAPRGGGEIIDMVALLQESLKKTAPRLRDKKPSVVSRPGARTTTKLVTQKRRKLAA